ncbi:MAG: hydantoinase/oxoprolinase family protein, partial [Candidatus Azotimanducaceae bacterium WSBS_2022_MAG_OTU7]
FFNLRYKKPTPFVPRYLRAEITERLDHTGAVRTGVALDELDDVIELFQKEGVEAIAVCFLHAYANPNHEQLVTAAIKQKWPDVPVVASHQITREWREYERTNTAVLSAYVQPVAQKYLEKLEQKLLSEKFAGSMYVMQSNGGIDTLSTVKAKPITMVESGPASGMLGAAMLGRLIDVPDIIALDIGGTTAKCSLIDQGAVRITNQYMIEQSPLKSGYPIMTPVVDIVEIGNGGGSIAWVDPDEKLHVGPKSAGALPGPVAYGKGGTQPTTTD